MTSVTPESLDIVVIGGSLSANSLLGAKVKGKVTAIMANEFIEWPLAATYFLAQPREYMRFVSPNKASFQLPGVDYIYDVVTGVRPQDKTIELKSGRTISYNVLVVATGFKLPVINCEVGVSLSERRHTVEMWGGAFASAKTVVVNGAGTIGLELAADIKLHNPSVRVVVLSRSGKILNANYPEDVLSRLMAELTRQGIEVLHATAPGGMTSPTAEPGSIQLASGERLAYDVFFPAYSQGMQTAFLPAAMLEIGSGAVLTNEFLQSTAHPEIFAIGCNSTGEGFGSALLGQQAKDVAGNVAKFLAQQPLSAHVPDKTNNGARPPMIKLGYGKGGYVMFDNVPGPVACCLRFCGFPFCPAPCCYGGCGGLSGAFACGWCCGGRAEGQATMDCFLAVFGEGGVLKFPANSNIMGMGLAPTGTETMSR